MTVSAALSPSAAPSPPPADTPDALVPDIDLAPHAEALQAGRHGDPFAVLGRHAVGGVPRLRVFAPGVRRVRARPEAGDGAVVELAQWQQSGLWSGVYRADGPYRLQLDWRDGATQDTADPYSYGPLLGDLDLHLIAEGRHHELARCLGAQAMRIAGVQGVRFAVWAPNARRVSVVGSFNGWDGLRHPMRLRQSAGVWELFIPGVLPGDRYKYELVGVDGQLLPQRADPMALATEMPPATASVVADPVPFRWTDEGWMQRRAAADPVSAPMAIYEVQAASWVAAVNATAADGRPNGWRLLADKLIPYTKALGFTHIELLPIMEHPFGGSWGYQPLGMFAPSARFGPPEAFATFVDRCHAAGIGVILDWVPAHFPSDAHGLMRFDGTALYEYADPREGFHQDWNTVIYNLGRHEVRGFMVASALHWIEHYHVDGLRVDAVASMLYRDYSRKAGEWIPNKYGGRENLETVDFLREFNTVVHARCPGAVTIAEESTAWPGVTAPVEQGGLGFDFKWNMGWMHDSLHYMQEQPVYRAWHHGEMTFSLVYAYSEKYVLPISHDEVVHGKGSLINKMPGDDWQKRANLRAYLGAMWSHPGKKLLFMGCELGQSREWNHDTEIDWWLLDDAAHAGIQRLVRDLNALHVAEPALHALDSDPAGFAWVVGDDNGNSVFAFLRKAPGLGRDMLVVQNMTPVPREGYRIGVPTAGHWSERLNSDAERYGGANIGNYGGVEAQEIPAHGHPYSVVLTLPPLAAVFLQVDG